MLTQYPANNPACGTVIAAFQMADWPWRCQDRLHTMVNTFDAQFVFFENYPRQPVDFCKSASSPLNCRIFRRHPSPKIASTQDGPLGAKQRYQK